MHEARPVLDFGLLLGEEERKIIEKKVCWVCYIVMCPVSLISTPKRNF